MSSIKVCQEQYNDLSKKFDSNYALVLEELNDILFWIKEVDLPPFSVQADEIQYEELKIQAPGNVFDYGHTISPIFYVDEKFFVLNYVYNWINCWKNGDDYDGHKQKKASIIIFDNNSNDIMCMYHFNDMWARSISNFTLKNKSSTPLELTVELKFDKWEPEFKYNP